MKRRIALLVLAVGMLPLAFVSAASAGRAQSNARPAGVSVHKVGPLTNQDFAVVFGGPYETHVFTIDISGGTKLQVSTQDCCIAGDHWGLLTSTTAAGSTVGAINTSKGKSGNGSTTAFTGKTTIFASSGHIIVVVSYVSGVDSFAAGMTVRVSYDGTATVTEQT